MLSNQVAIENNLSVAMLEEIIVNQDIKQALTEISLPLLSRLITPTREALKKVNGFAELGPLYQMLLQDLAEEHSNEKLQFGALMPTFPSAKSILGSKQNIEKLLNLHEEKLTNINKVETIEDVAKVIKTIIELSCIYYHAPSSWHSEDFSTIKDYITPNQEELDIRLYRKELGQKEQLAITFGIGKDENDLAPKEQGQGRNAGKAAFGLVSMQARLECLCQQYDNAPTDLLKNKLNYYQIPLDSNDRENIEVYAKKWETFFEKLVNHSFPLIASVSWATTRVLVSLQDLKAFDNKDGQFDFDKAQRIANCLMGFLVRGSHHSTVEVAEMYNRLLDYIAITYLEKNKQPILPVSLKERVEEKLPYFRYDNSNYHHFFHRDYAEKITTKIPQMKF